MMIVSACNLEAEKYSRWRNIKSVEGIYDVSLMKNVFILSQFKKP